MKKPINRKEFLLKTFTGITGLGLVSKQLNRMNFNEVQLRKLGNTGILVCPVCFGATRTNDESLIKYGLEKGINFIDTGRSYGNGNNERLVGRAITGIRKNVIIQTKIKLETDEIPSKGKGKKGAEEIRSALSSKIDASLKALNTDYIDILLYHSAQDENLLFHPEVMKFFSEKKKTGVIRAHGFSTHNDNMNFLSRNNRETFYDVVMIPFNHKGSYVHSVSGLYSEWDQNKLIPILTEAGEKNIGIISMKTCSGGPYSTAPGIKPDFKEAVKWVIQHKFISAAAVAMASFEQVNDHITLLQN
jgi:uncharacterized protein